MTGCPLWEKVGGMGAYGSEALPGSTITPLPTEATGRCHPERARGTRASEGSSAPCRTGAIFLRMKLERPTQTTRLMVGIADLLVALEPHEADRRALVGLLTGNVAPGAALKLRSAGLDPARFRVGAYGSDSARRAELPAVAAARAAALTGASFAGTDVIIVGDTPDDVACGRAIGARSVAVATGSYDVAALRATGAAYVFATLSDTAAVLDAIFA